MAKPALSFTIDVGPSSQSRTTRRRRVSSPSAAKTNAELARSVFACALRCLTKVFLDQRHDHAPALYVCREGLRAPRQGDLIEARFGDGEHDAVVHVIEREHDERRR